MCNFGFFMNRTVETVDMSCISLCAFVLFNNYFFRKEIAIQMLVIDYSDMGHMQLNNENAGNQNPMFNSQ